MHKFAYCLESSKQRVRRIVGVEPVTCPPIVADGFDPSILEGHELIYFKLHGLKDQPFWYGDHWSTALTAKQILEADLGGAVVFAANCYMPDSPMKDALLKAGASIVIGGFGKNYFNRWFLDGADALASLFVRELEKVYGSNANKSKTKTINLIKIILDNAKEKLGKRWFQSRATKDALLFQMFS